MAMTRRNLLITGTAATGFTLMAPSIVLAANAARRDFVINLGRRQVGASSVSLSRSGSTITADISANLNISILGLVNFSYDLTAREVWQDGALQSLDATTDNDGTADFVRARSASGGVQVEGSRWSGLIQGNPATTSFFAAEFLSRPVWLSTQDGNALNVRAGNAGAETLATPGGDVAVTRYTVRGDMEIDLFYTAAGEWVGSRRTLAGQRISFLAAAGAGSLVSVWMG